MKYLLDTDILVDHLRKKKVLEENVLKSEAAISIITFGELLYGVYKSDNQSRSLELLKYTITTLKFDILNLNEQVMMEFGRIKADLEKYGQKLDDFDLLIASIAMVNGLMLVTGNVNHFKRIKGLKIA